MKKMIVFIIIVLSFLSCKKDKINLENIDKRSSNINLINNKEIKTYITFIELGSVNCIPCKMMQPVMRKVEKNFKENVKVIFYDVWTEKDKNMTYKYKIKVIPTQIFLDKNGKEYFRHEGYFPYEEVEKIIKMKL